ncbi:MAG: transglutaminase domain-containing protein [Bradymonadaceae bacterium]|nr:transglutaminase domain-containing protein [Lujinxingiaceae bacterium]
MVGTGAAIVLLAVGAEVVSQESRRNGVTLHEYFDPAWAGASSDGVGPARESVNQRPGEPPGLSLEAGRDELILTGDGPLADVPIEQPHGALDPRTGANRLDDQTDRVDELSYFAQFDPSVIPYKRQVVQNRVVRSASGDYTASLSSNRERPVAIEGTRVHRDEDTFWGSFLVRAEPGALHPIPSVSPDQRLLRVESEPAAALRFVRDQADNFYVASDYAGLIRVNVQIAAPRFYFDGELGKDIGWNDFPSGLVVPLSEEVRAVATRVMGKLGVSRRQTPHAALMDLVEYFRDFEGRPLPASARTGDLFETIALGKFGVCRHRSLAFVIIAQTLGIPTRYVYNEAHAFVEVYWPGESWRRIDLGGAAEDVNMRQDGQRRIHDGARNDTLPKPPAYLSELERIMGQDSPGDDASPGGDQAGDQQIADGDRQGTAGEQAHGQAGETQALPSEHDLAPEAIEITAPVAEIDDARRPITIRIISADQQVLRGRAIEVRGELAANDGTPLANRSVRVLLGPVGASSGAAAMVLGTATTGQDGHFLGQFDIARTVSIGRWALIAVFDGDENDRPAATAASGIAR